MENLPRSGVYSSERHHGCLIKGPPETPSPVIKQYYSERFKGTLFSIVPLLCREELAPQIVARQLVDKIPNLTPHLHSRLQARREKFASAVLEADVSRHNGCSLGVPQWYHCTEGFEGVLNWVPMRPGDDSFSVSCTPDRCSFSSLGPPNLDFAAYVVARIGSMLNPVSNLQFPFNLQANEAEDCKCI